LHQNQNVTNVPRPHDVKSRRLVNMWSAISLGLNVTILATSRCLESVLRQGVKTD